MDLKSFIRDVPDFPIKGIVFKDITTLLENSNAFNNAINQMVDKLDNYTFDKIVAIESRGFIFASTLSYIINKPLILIRKSNKLPAETESIEYDLEYGSSSVEIHKNSISKKDNVIIVDDLLATGGSAFASIKLIERMGGIISGLIFLVDLTDLNGGNLLRENNYKYSSIIDY